MRSNDFFEEEHFEKPHPAPTPELRRCEQCDLVEWCLLRHLVWWCGPCWGEVIRPPDGRID